MAKPIYKIKRVNTGIYLLSFPNGACVRLERYPSGLWHTFNENAHRRGAIDAYWNDYRTKANAIAHLVAYADQLET